MHHYALIPCHTPEQGRPEDSLVFFLHPLIDFYHFFSFPSPALAQIIYFLLGLPLWVPPGHSKNCGFAVNNRSFFVRYFSAFCFFVMLKEFLDFVKREIQPSFECSTDFFFPCVPAPSFFCCIHAAPPAFSVAFFLFPFCLFLLIRIFPPRPLLHYRALHRYWVGFSLPFLVVDLVRTQPSIAGVYDFLDFTPPPIFRDPRPTGVPSFGFFIFGLARVCPPNSFLFLPYSATPFLVFFFLGFLTLALL